MNETTSSIAVTDIVSIAHGYRLQHEQAQEGWVLLYPEGMVKLNQSAAEIMRRCDGKRALAEVIDLLEKDFEQTGLTDDVLGFAGVALQQKWLTIVNG